MEVVRLFGLRGIQSVDIVYIFMFVGTYGGCKAVWVEGHTAHTPREDECPYITALQGHTHCHVQLISGKS